MTKTRKLDLPLARLDDWDLLQAAFEASFEEIGPQPGFDIEAILEKEFPQNRPKQKQEARLKIMLSQRNEWGYTREPHKEVTPTDILADALSRILNESRLSQRKTVRQLISPYLDTRMAPVSQGSPLSPRCPWTKYFRRDFWDYLSEEKINGAQWLTPSKEIQIRLQPGEQRTLEALKHIAPEGLTVEELGPLTRKDALSEDTPRNSLDAWLKGLKDKELATFNSQRPKKWFFVKDYES